MSAGGVWPRRRPWQACAWVLLACLVLSEALSDPSKRPKTYLLPMLRFGPNNQKRDFRHTLAVAKYLDCGMIMTGIYKHHWDITHLHGLNMLNSTAQATLTAKKCFRETFPHFLEMDEIIDTEVIAQWVPTTTVGELKEQGWNGELDAVVYTQNWWWLGRRDIDKTLKATGVVLAKDAKHISLPGFLGCKQDAVAQAKETLSQFRYVGVVHVLLKESERPRIFKEPSVEPKDKCLATQYQADRLLHPSPWLRNLAQQYADRHLGGRPYLAVHVRPYPDTCVEEWRAGVFDSKRLLKHCLRELATLHSRIVPCTQQLMRAANVSDVFVLTHPVVQQVVDSLFGKAGIRPYYLNMTDIFSIAQCRDHSSTFMALVEEQLAVRADTFLGTSFSTITHTIAFERMGRGAFSNHYFEHLTTC